MRSRDGWLHRHRHWVVGGVNLAAVLALYFTVPVRATQSPVRLALDLGVSVAAVAVAGRVLFTETLRLSSGVEGRLNGLRLVLLLEIVTLVFALTYYILAVRGHDQMAGVDTRVDALYFTVVTMTTVGYGDIHPVGQLARGIATAHLMFDLVFIAAFAGLVRTTVSSKTRPPSEKPGAEPPRQDE